MIKTLIGCCFVSGTLLLAVPAAQAAVFDVTNPAEFQSALTTAGTNGEDDTINVAAGTYNLPATLIYSAPETNALAIVGAGAASTFIDGGGAMRVLSFTNGLGGDISLSGLTVRNGSTSFGGGGLSGGTDGTFTISDCVFSGNQVLVSDGGGFYLLGGNVTITDSTFINNTAAADGGGFSLLGGNVTITGSTFINNTAAANGGGGVVSSALGTVAVSDSTFSGNTATNFGGGFYSDVAATLSITGSTFSGNTTNVTGQGGGLLVNQAGPGALTISNNAISGNLTGGSCAAGGGLGVGIAAVAEGPMFFTRNIVANNTTPCETQGAGIVLYRPLPSTDTALVADNIFSGNTSGPGTVAGPVLFVFDSGVINVVNNTFSGNDSDEPAAFDVLFSFGSGPGSVNVSNNIFFGAAGEDVLSFLYGAGTLITFRNNIIDPSRVPSDPVSVTESGNFLADPLFADMAGGDFHLSYGSPAIDAGLSTAPGIQLLDVDGDDRITGDAVDIGADEFPPNPATFFPSTGTLAIPEVQVGTRAYQVEMARLDEPGYVFTLADARKMTATGTPSALFDTATGVLDIAVVEVQGMARTYHVLMQRRPGGYVFDLTKAMKN